MIKKIFVQDPDTPDGALSKNGIYTVIAYIRGEPKKIVVDDTMPVTKSGKLLFSEPHPGTLNCWPVILEKVWSKISVNYEKTCAGWQHECVRVFTGAGATDYII